MECISNAEFKDIHLAYTVQQMAIQGILQDSTEQGFPTDMF